MAAVPLLGPVIPRIPRVCAALLLVQGCVTVLPLPLAVSPPPRGQGRAAPELVFCRLFLVRIPGAPSSCPVTFTAAELGFHVHDLRLHQTTLFVLTFWLFRVDCRRSSRPLGLLSHFCFCSVTFLCLILYVEIELSPNSLFIHAVGILFAPRETQQVFHVCVLSPFP